VENSMTRILRDFVALKPATSSIGEAQALRGEVEANVSKVKIELTQLVNTTMERMQAEADRRAEAMLQKLTQILRLAPRNHINRVAPVIDTKVALGRSTRVSGSREQNQTTRATQPSLPIGYGGGKLTLSRKRKGRRRI
jgi:hypothetical protein